MPVHSSKSLSAMYKQIQSEFYKALEYSDALREEYTRKHTISLVFDGSKSDKNSTPVYRSEDGICIPVSLFKNTYGTIRIDWVIELPLNLACKFCKPTISTDVKIIGGSLRYNLKGYAPFYKDGYEWCTYKDLSSTFIDGVYGIFGERILSAFAFKVENDVNGVPRIIQIGGGACNSSLPEIPDTYILGHKTERMVRLIIKYFGANIKAVVFLSDIYGKYLGKCVYRKNDDGEFTMLVY